MAPPRLTGLTKLTLETAPTVCHNCVWWQSRSSRRDVDKDRWMSRVEEEYGAFGTIYYGDDGRTLGSIQYGPAPLFPHAWELPGGPPSEDALLITCAYLVDTSSPWVLQSLFLAAIGEARDRGASCVEAFAYRYVEGESGQARFLEHRTAFPSDFLGDLGFRIVRTSGRVGLARLDLGGLQPVEEGTRQRVLRVVKEAFLPDPVPAPRP
jgi:hypothetical protein